MGWRTVVVSKPSKLDLRLGYMVVRDSESTIRVHINEIIVLIIENTMSSITTALLNELTKQKIKVIFCDEKQSPSSELVSYYGCHDCSRKLKDQIRWQDVYKQMVWTVIVTEKIKMQAENLDFFDLKQSKLLYSYLDEIEFNDATNREGHAAKVYFNALFGKSFTRSDDNPINAMLNYGYSIILSCFNREIVSSGYLTQLGLFHDNVNNPYNLSCDMMEPFRPIIDRFVKIYNPTKFEKEEKYEILTILNKEFIMNSRKLTLINAIKSYSHSIFEAIESGDTSLIKFYNYEL